jgi:hypothetical protein
MLEDNMVKVCKVFRHRLEAMVEEGSGYFDKQKVGTVSNMLKKFYCDTPSRS